MDQAHAKARAIPQHGSIVAAYLNAYFGLSFVEGAVYWLLSTFLFAAVATHVLAEETNTRPLADDYSLARERIGPILTIGILSWTCFKIGRVASSFLPLTLADRFHLRGFGATLLFAVPSLLLIGLLSRFGLTVPWLLDHPAESVRQSISKTVRKTENWEMFFMLFMIKSAMAAYAVYWLAQRVLDWFVHSDFLSATAVPWISGLFYISIAAALGTPLFISLSLLYLEKTVARSEPLPVPVE